MTQQLDLQHNGAPIIETEPEAGPLALIDKAVTLGLGADAIAKLWEIQKDIEDRNARQEFVRAMNLFKRNPPPIKRTKHVKYDTKTGGRVDYWHVELDKACDKILPALAAVGISHRWETSQAEGLITVTCVLTHELGHGERTTLQGLPDDTGGKNKIQAVGSAVYYLERYTLMAAVGLAAEGQDSDGQVVASAGGMDQKDLRERLEYFAKCSTFKELEEHWRASRTEAKKAKDSQAQDAIDSAKNARKEQLRTVGAK